MNSTIKTVTFVSDQGTATATAGTPTITVRRKSDGAQIYLGRKTSWKDSGRKAATAYLGIVHVDAVMSAAALISSYLADGKSDVDVVDSAHRLSSMYGDAIWAVDTKRIDQ